MSFEVESRGPLTHSKYQELRGLLSEKGKFKESKDRVFIDFSTHLEGIENREKDIRLRKTNDIPEIILKLGNWGEAESRKEISVKTEPGTFKDLIYIFGEIGLTRGVFCHRKSEVFDYKNVEFALVEVPNHSYYFEAEKLVENKKEAQKAQTEIEEVCAELDLKMFSKEEFFEYIRLLNKEANTEYIYPDSDLTALLSGS